MEERLARVTAFPLPGGGSIDIDIRPQEVVRIVGANGCGKTSLLRALAGLDAPIRPKRVASYPCGFAMQNAQDSLIGLTVAGEFRLRGQAPPDEMDRLHDQDVATLSAGECRRVATAAAMEHRPLVLLDEPSEGLDAAQMKRLQHRMRQVCTRGGTVVVVDHGDRWSDAADRTITLSRTSDRPFPRFQAPDGRTLLRHDGTPFTIAGRRFHPPSFTLGPGFHALTGPNGSGKTQFLLRLRTDDARMMPADARSVLTSDTVADELQGIAREQWEPWIGDHLLDRHPWTLSGGEQQRLALLRILSGPNDVILLDEPEARLDEDGRALLHRLMRERIAAGGCILAATHDAQLIEAAQNVFVMESP